MLITLLLILILILPLLLLSINATTTVFQLLKLLQNSSAAFGTTGSSNLLSVQTCFIKILVHLKEKYLNMFLIS